VRAVTEPTARLPRLDQERPAPVQSWRLRPGVDARQARRGVRFTVAVTMGAERGELTRCATPRPLMKGLGLMPSEYARGERRRRGALTKAGNTHARRAIVEGAWAYRYPAHVSRHLQRRLDTHPQAVQDISRNAPVRSCQRDRRLRARGQHANHVVVALARELGGFRWAMAQQVPVTPSLVADDCTQPCDGGQRAGKEPQPRRGVTLDGVQSPGGILVPRARQAPDGRQSGGTNPRRSAGSTVGLTGSGSSSAQPYTG
jgi:transposase